MKKAVVAAVLLFFSFNAFALEFRNTSWLMTREEVIASESGRVVSELNLPGQQQIVFRTLVNGYPAVITYLLEDDKLLSASYSFKRDLDRGAFDAMKLQLEGQNGKPSFEKDNLVGWRLSRTEIALAHLPDGTTYAAYWEKTYFARINNMAGSGSSPKF